MGKRLFFFPSPSLPAVFPSLLLNLLSLSLSPPLTLIPSAFLSDSSPKETCLQEDARKDRRDLSPIRINVVNVCISRTCKKFDTWYKFTPHRNRCVSVRVCAHYAKWLYSVMSGSQACSLFSPASAFCHAVLLLLGMQAASWKFAVPKHRFLQHRHAGCSVPLSGS